MTLLLVGFTGFVLGVAAIIFGRSLHAREVAGRRGGVDDVLEKFLDWYLHKVLARSWRILTGANSTIGERVAEAGSIIAGLGVVAMVAGVVRLALA
jgi:hypothetical protein